MERHIPQWIATKEKHLLSQPYSAFGRVMCQWSLFFLYLFEASRCALHVLFTSQARSFQTVSVQNTAGTWRDSYVEHIRFQQRARIASLGLFFMIVLASSVSASVMHVLFPPSPTSAARIAGARQTTSIITVSNLNDSGIGSLRQAIADAASGDTIFFADNLRGTIAASSSFLVDKELEIDGSSNNASIVIDGSTMTDDNQNGFSCNGQVNLHDVAIQNFPHHGVAVQSGDANNCNGSNFENLTIKGNGGAGIELTQLSNVIVRGNTIQDNGEIGVEVFGGQDNIVENNTVSDNASEGIYVWNSDGSTVDDATIHANTVTDNGDTGIVAQNAKNITIQDNTVRSNAQHGIEANSGTIIAINENIIDDNGGAGILVWNNAENVTIKDNAVSNNVGAGVDLVDSSDIRVGRVGAGNTITGNGSWGVGVRLDVTKSVTGISIIGNSMTNNGQGGIDFAEGDNVNNGIQPPDITTCTNDTMSGKSGTGESGGTVHLYASDGEGEGETYLGSVTVEDGAWSTDSSAWTPADGVEDFGDHNSFVATVTNSDDSTSEFSEECPEAIAEEPGTESDDLADEIEADASEEDENSATPDDGSLGSLSLGQTFINGVDAGDATMRFVQPEGFAASVLFAGRMRILGILNKDGRDVARVRLRVRHNDTTIDEAIVQVADTQWQHVLPVDLVTKGENYILRGRDADETDANYETLAAAYRTNPAPTLLSYRDPVAVVPSHAEMLFTGVYHKGFHGAVVSVKDADGALYQCDDVTTEDAATTASMHCTMSGIPLGQYFLGFQSLHGAMPSLPQRKLFVVAQPVDVNVFNTDNRNAALYTRRITTAETIKLVGLGPAGTVPEVYHVTIDGEHYADDAQRTEKKIAEGTFTSTIGWQADVSLTSLTRGRAHLLEIRFLRAATQKEDRDARFVYPILFAQRVVDPLVDLVDGQEVIQDTRVTAQVTSGKNYNLMVTDNGAVIAEKTLTAVANVQGSASFRVPTSARGQHILRMTVTDPPSGLAKSITRTIHVVAPAIPAVSSEEGVPKDVATPISEKPAPQEEPLPTRTPDVLQQQQEEIVVSVLQEQYTITGSIVTAKETVIDTGGTTTIYQTKVIGLPEALPWARRTKDYVTFTGTTVPFARVTLTLRSEALVQVTRADSNGQWKIAVAVENLPAGEHTASLKTTVRGVESQEVEIAKFVVVQERRLSQSTILFFVNMSVAMILLIMVLVVRMRHVPKPLPLPRPLAPPPTSPRPRDDDDNLPPQAPLGI